MGDGTPKGLPLNCRFSRSVVLIRVKNVTQPTRRLAPLRDGEPLSSSSRISRGHALSFPIEFMRGTSLSNIKTSGGIIPDETNQANPARG